MTCQGALWGHDTSSIVWVNYMEFDLVTNCKILDYFPLTFWCFNEVHPLSKTLSHSAGHLEGRLISVDVYCSKSRGNSQFRVGWSSRPVLMAGVGVRRGHVFKVSQKASQMSSGVSGCLALKPNWNCWPKAKDFMLSSELLQYGVIRRPRRNGHEPWRIYTSHIEPYHTLSPASHLDYFEYFHLSSRLLCLLGSLIDFKVMMRDMNSTFHI